MEHAPIPDTTSRIVELDSVLGDLGYLASHPSVRAAEVRPDGALRVLVDEHGEDWPALANAPPGRPPEVELHGPGAPCGALTQHPRAECVQLFVDALGDPDAAPRGWWHAQVWLRPA